jgi:hypothetical protein
MTTVGAVVNETQASPTETGIQTALRAVPAVVFPDEEAEAPSETLNVLPTGQLETDWSLFRSLLPYYRKCLQSDGRAALTYSLDRFGVQFVLCRPRGKWWPTLDGGTLLRIDVGLLPPSFLEALARRRGDRIHVGYPLALVDKDTLRSENGFIRPVASLAAEWRITGKILEVRLPVMLPDLNSDWMKYQRDRGKSIRTFLRDVGAVSELEGGLATMRGATSSTYRPSPSA